MLLINVYGSWGSKLQDTAKTMKEALDKAQKASAKDPKNEYCVEAEPSGFDNPLFKAGVRIDIVEEGTSPYRTDDYYH